MKRLRTSQLIIFILLFFSASCGGPVKEALDLSPEINSEAPVEEAAESPEEEEVVPDETKESHNGTCHTYVAPLGNVSGMIQNSVTWGFVSGAAVRFTDIGNTCNVRTATTNSSGSYSITGIQSGTYNVRITASGYQTRNVSNFYISAGSGYTGGSWPITSNCPNGRNGRYCGATLGLNSNTLYQCTNGSNSVVETCSYSCQINPPGTDDQCRPPPPLPTPTLRFPSNGSSGVSRTPQLDWYDVSGATGYRVFVSTSYSTLSSLSNTAPDCSGCLVWIPSSSYQDIPSGYLSGGTTYYWRVRAGNLTQGSENSSIWSFTTAPDLPNLTSYTPPGWSGPIVPSNSTGTTTTPGSLSACSTVYVDWAIINNGAGNATSSFVTCFYVDGVVLTCRSLSGLDSNRYYPWWTDTGYTIGAGLHTLSIITDADHAVTESNESTSDNSYQQPFTFSDCGPSTQITSPSSGFTTTAPSITVSGSCSDGGGNLRDVTVLNATTGSSTVTGLTGYNGGFSPGVSLAYGSNTLRATCRDWNGNSSTATITVTRPPLPDLVPYTQPGWPGPITASSVPGTTSNGTLYACRPTYFDFSWQNQGSGNISNTFYNNILIDNSLIDQRGYNGLSAGWPDALYDYTISSITPGTHTVAFRVDATYTVAETSEGNNEVSIPFTWNPCNDPSASITSPPNGGSTTAGNVTVSGSCGDADGNLSSVSVVSETYGWSANPVGMSGTLYTFDVPNVPLAIGWNTLRATCYDTFGASHSTTISYNRDVCPDAEGTLRENPQIGNSDCNHNEDGDQFDDRIDACWNDVYHDGVGDPCDHDEDNDGILDGTDNCGETGNIDQANFDGDLLGDACDPDDDNDTVADGGDSCANTVAGQGVNAGGCSCSQITIPSRDCPADACSGDNWVDYPEDGSDVCANGVLSPHSCEALSSVYSANCDPDDDNDTILDEGDNCPNLANVDQANFDLDATGDACDSDDDNDGVNDPEDLFPNNPAEAVDTDGDGTGNNADPDDDNDGTPDVEDPFPLQTNHAPSLESIGDQIINEGETLTLEIQGGDPDGDTLTYRAENLPIGASFDVATHLFVWAPTFEQSGEYPGVRFIVSDQYLEDSVSITIAVDPINRPPVFEEMADQTVGEGETLSFTLAVSDPDGNPIVTSADSLPSGASFDAASLTFEWIPNLLQQGVYSTAFTASDGNFSDRMTVRITVIDETPPSEVSSFAAEPGFFDGEIVLSWTVPNEADWRGVRVLRKIGAPIESLLDGETAYEGTGASLIDEGLDTHSAYFYRAFSFDDVGNFSAGLNSTPASLQPTDLIPPASVALVIEPADSGLRLHWTPPADPDFDSVILERGGVVLFDGAENSYRDLVTGSASYCYRTRSRDTSGNVSDFTTPACFGFQDPDRDGIDNTIDTDDDADNVLDVSDACPLDPNDPVDDPCNHDQDADGILDVSDLCPFDAVHDPLDDPCDHDEDNDGIGDTVDFCPRYTNDTVNNPCNPDDNANLVFEGGEIHVTMIQGEVNQTQQFNVTNNGTGNMVYTFSRDEETPWLNLVKNGGETNTFTEPTHTLSPGESDQYTVTLVSNSIPAETRVANTIILASNDTSSGTASVPISMSVEAAPYCPLLPEQLVCRASPTQTLGNQSSNVQNFSDPVNTATGNFAHHHTDLVLAGRGLALSFSRTYNSQDKYIGPLGYGWTHSYNILLSEFSDGTVQTRWGDGHFETYTRNEDGTYEAPKGIFSNLVKTDDQFTLTTKNHVIFQFSNKGRLSSIQDRNGNRLALTYDEKNRLTQVADLIGRSLSFAYGAEDSFKLTSITDSAGRSVSFSYNEDDLVSADDVLGNTTRYEYDSHRMTKVVDPLGNNLVENAYDENARVIEQRDGKGNLSRLAFESPEPGHVLVTDPLGQTMRQVYDDRLRVVESTDPAGRAVLYQYNETNLRTQVTDRQGQNLRAEYDERGNLTSLTDPLNIVTQFEYDSETDDLTKIIHPNEHERSFEYDDEGNLIRTWEELDGELLENHYTHNEWGQLLTSTDALENTTTYRYDSAGNFESITDPAGGVTQFDHDNAGQLVAVTDPLSRTTQFEYDADGRTTRVINSAGSAVRYEYDANGNIVRFTDQNGQSTDLEWNENNFLEVLRDALGNETSFVYDSLNRKTQMTDPENRTVQFEYNSTGKPESMTDPAGRITRFVYDNEGNLASETDTAGEVTSYSYDSMGRLIRVTDPLENITDYTYDSQAGFLTQTTDAEGQVAQYEYDDLGRLTVVVDPLGQRTSFEYDAVGNFASLANPGGHTTTFAYDSLGRLISQTNALGETEQYFYDLASQMNRSVDGEGQETQYNYDQIGRLTRFTVDDGSSVSYTYDSTGKRLSRTDSLGTMTYAYDALGRLTSLQDPRGFQIGYGYDRSGLISRLTYPGDRTIQYAYNASGQLNQLTDWLGNTTIHTHDTAGRLDQMVYPNGFKTTYEYDSASRLIRLANRRPDESLLSSYEFMLDRLGNRVEVEKEEPLTPWISPEDLAATHNEENELLTLGDLTFDYDANGNLILANAPDGDTHYSFDTQDRLSSILSPMEETTFGYDGDGNRISLTRAGETTRFVVDPSRGLPDVIAETDGNDAIQSLYVYGLGLNAQISADGSEVHYYHYDPIGSTIALSSVAGDVTDQYLYDEFGAVNRRTGTTPNLFQFVGQFGVQTDGTGLHYMRARYYDPRTGRFVSRDPIGFSGGMNLYGYVNNNPILNIDPSGNYIETAWDVANLSLGTASLADNVQKGDWGWAVLDVLGLAYDGVATYLPFLPAGGSTALKLIRGGSKVADAVDVGLDVAHVADTAHDITRAADTTTDALQAGTMIHHQVDDALRQSNSLSSSAQNSFRGSNGAAGLAPDLTWGNSPGVWADLTTPGSWNSHVTKYGDEFGEGIPILYQRGQGVVNMQRLHSGAGMTLTGTQWLTGQGFSSSAAPGSISSQDPCNYYMMTCSLTPKLYTPIFSTPDLSGSTVRSNK